MSITELYKSEKRRKVAHQLRKALDAKVDMEQFISEESSSLTKKELEVLNEFVLDMQIAISRVEGNFKIEF